MLKITKNINEANLITHGSKFHADDVFATAFMSLVIENSVVCRVNSVGDDIPINALVYDIGFGRFDHHQKDFDLRHNSGVKYASFGLLFNDFGKKYLDKINSQYSDSVFLMVEHDLIEAIDAIDNGDFPEVNTTYNYKSIDSIIGDFNASWNEDIDNDICFMRAVGVAEMILVSVIKKCFAKAAAKEIVEEAIENSTNHIMYLNEYMPFKDFVISSTNSKATDILFCITPSNRGGYNVHTIPKDKNTHITRCDLPKEWGGLFDDELQKVSGVESATFCHSSLFLGACLSLDDAYKMARIAIENKSNLE